MRSILPLLFVFLFTGALFAQSGNYYTVKFPDDRTIFGCGVTADTIWPIITNQYGCSYNVGVAVKDQIFYTNDEQTCYKVLRKWTLLYWCDYNPNWSAPLYIQNPTNTDVGPTVVGNSTNHGYISYTQVIKVVDNVPPVFLNCPAQPLVFCDNTNNDPAQYNSNYVDRCEGPVDLKVAVTDLCSKSDILLTYRLFLDLDGNGTMETYKSSSDANAWPIETTVVADTLYGKIKFPTGFGLPYGRHKVEWIANDHCAGESLCKYEFTVKDCKAPTVVCMSGLSVNIMQTGMITFWDTDFLQYTYDNCTPTNQLKIAIRKSGAGSGFPNNNHSVTFDCTEIGPQFVEIWSQDAYGNGGYCETYVNIQDHVGTCPAPQVSGNISTDQNKAVPDVKVKMKSESVQFPGSWESPTDAAGLFTLTNIPGQIGKYSLTPALDTKPASGVSSLDALLAAAHINGTQPISATYRLIAADVNRDKLINDADVQQIMKMATGQITAFTNNTSWRFVPKSYVFPNPANPFTGTFPEKISLTTPGSRDFIGIKTGDLDGSVVPGSLLTQDDRSAELDPVTFTATEASLRPGAQVRVDLKTPELNGIAGFQFTLGYDQSKLSLSSIEPGLIPAEYIGSFADQGMVSAGWIYPAALNGADGKSQKTAAFSLIFNVLQDGELHDALYMNDLVAASQAYDSELGTRTAQLEFVRAAPGKARAQLYPVQPNPVTNQCTAIYYLPEAGQATLRLTNADGNVVATFNILEASGTHRQVLDLSGVPAHGMLFLHLESASGVAVQKLMRVEGR